MGQLEGVGFSNQTAAINYNAQDRPRGPGKGNHDNHRPPGSRKLVAEQVKELRALARRVRDRALVDASELEAKATKLEREDAELTAEYGPAKENTP